MSGTIARPLPLAEIVSVHPFGSHLHDGRGTAFVVLVAFLVSFLAIRTSARLTRSVSWWPGGVKTENGVHLHHLVWGICLILLAGFLSFAGPLSQPWRTLVAVAFGVGAGFTLDEFALWVRLEDVYWTQEGRSSVDAVVVACGFAGLVVLGTRPFGLDDPGSIWGTVGTVAVMLGLTLTAVAKGRIFLGVTGLFIPVAGLVGAFQIARPSSVWAKRRYSPEMLARAQRRYAPTTYLSRLSVRLSDAVTGAPSEERSGRDGP
jgi:hypothetical protein